jgi:hypothetical protein
MSLIRIKLSDYIIIGGDPNTLHTQYKLIVDIHLGRSSDQNNMSSWAIYRRYSEFDKLHQSLIEVVGVEKIVETKLFLPVDYIKINIYTYY